MSSSTRRGASSIAVLVLFLACGESHKTKPPVVADGGQAGEAGEAAVAVEIPDPVKCGSVTCKAIELPSGAVAPCCANPLEGICGAELGPTMACQPLTQPGQLDLMCPAITGGMIGGFPVPPLPGCCRPATGECGYLVTDLAGLLPFAPGCVDAALFLEGEEPVACGPGTDAGGAGGAGGMPGVTDPGGAAGRSGDGGESTAAGAGGAGVAGDANGGANGVP
jgi:hypothetical protein